MATYSETILFTALPNGLEGEMFQTLKLSLLITPRLSPTGVLGDFHLGNWPERMKQLGVGIEFAGMPAVTLAATVKTGLLDPSLWAALFPDTTPVTGWALPPYASREIKSFPAAKLHQFINGLYGAVASDPASATQFPSTTDASTPVGQLIDTVGKLDEIICDVVRPNGTVGTAAVGQGRALPPSRLHCVPKDEREVLKLLGNGVVRDFFLARQFYDRPNKRDISYHGEDIGPIPPPPAVQQIDFHQAVGLLGDHPRVLRMLGLIVDLEIDTAKLRGGLGVIPTPSRMQVKLTGFDHGPSTTTETPWTNYTLGEEHFFATPRGPQSDLGRGHLKLGKKGAFEVMQVDVDGAALNVLQFATNMRRYQVESALTTPQGQTGGADFAATAPGKAALPALRGGGITIAKVDRKDAVKTAFVINTANDLAPSAASLYAEDVNRGYRVDVLSDGKWHSLCRRHVKYTLPGVAMFEVDDEEGYVQGASATSTDGAPTSDVYLHESMFGWSGWSLVAQRPSHVMSFERLPDNKQKVKPVPRFPNRPPADLIMMGTVPYDVETDVRAQPGSLPRLRYGKKYRFRARCVDMAGNSLPFGAQPPPIGDFVSDELTYRRYEPVASPALGLRAKITEGEQLENMVVRSRVNLDPAFDAKLPPELFNATNERHVVPPKTSQDSYETHGMLDGLGKAASYYISSKENGTLQDPKVVNEADGTLVDVSANMVVVKDDGTFSMDFPEPGDPLPRQHYILHTADEIRLPYLPDPLSVGVAYLGFPGKPYQAHSFGGALPALTTLRLKLETGGSFGFGPPAGQELKAVLPPGTMAQIRYSSVPDAARLEELAIWGLVTAASKATLHPFAIRGLLWMMTPHRELQLVHAVERPIEKPTLHIFLVDEPDKQLGQTYSRLEGKVGSHAPSTGEAEIAARWTEVEDRLDDNPMGVTREERLGHITDLKILYAEKDRSFPKPPENPIKHEFGDTKHRFVEYRPVGTTRYREYFPHAVTEDKAIITLAGDYQPPPVGDKPAGLNVLSTARPTPPQVLYIVPTFAWEKTEDGLTRKRTGRGLRVYLDRPWYSSGDGELLAAVLAPAIRNDPPWVVAPVTEGIRRHISEWGADPVSSKPTSSVRFDLRPVDFVNPDKVVLDGLSLAELRNDAAQRVRAVGFPVQYNAERKLWYCDIQMDPGSAYYPYVRLSLARLQPDSIDHAHLSPVVRTEFAQLVADRTATIKRVDEDPFEIFQITVVGFSATTDFGNRLLNANGQGAPPFAVKAPDTVGNALAEADPQRDLGGEGGRPQVGAIGQPPPELIGPTPGGPPFFFGPYRNPAAGAGHSVRAHIERRPAGMAPENDLGWEKDSEEITLLSYTFPASPEVIWKGPLRHLKNPIEAADAEYRLVIREFEQYDTDPEVAQVNINLGKLKISMRERLVYLDVFPLGLQ